ncbi:antibiotic biosynthesis monooxygenase [Tianweitania sp. BSSL-BM11]|uniref:Antibiotic biosynthesis monooxygenase n=1 Tax=Tianweitania aestuarii TaxID=2814886 RepID=A0ABS5RY54_9HYPH|nr:antibiotic biosynthesis monooxygenase family protein [Tianweitania aestuarii]MBS9721975.1 antibiotic biosynthesis monooxygenase [Tianweitania aestuarii]
MQMKPLDPAFPIQQQLGLSHEGPIVLGNLFTIDAADEDAFLAAWAVDAAYMKAQPGFISTQLHRALGSSPAYFNSAVWESLDAFRAAFTNPAFQAKLTDYPASAVASPHLFQRVAVPGICTE